MIHLFLYRHFVAFVSVMMLVSAFFTTSGIAQQNTSTFSGSVVDTDGKPVPSLQLAVKPIEFVRGREIGERKPISTWVKSTTDKKGFFSFSNIDPGTSRLVMFPDHGSKYEIVSFQIGDITVHSTAFLQHHPTNFGKIIFGVAPNENITDVIVRVKKPRMRVSGRIFLPDGTPLVNTKFELYVSDRRGDSPIYALSSSRSSGLSGGMFTTDSEGYFVSYFPEEAGEHMVIVKFEGVTARTRWFRMKDGEQKDGLVFKLRNLDKKRAERAEREKAREAVWLINPANGHAYKKIKCESYADAITAAKSENAHLVAINDEAEQEWLEAAIPNKEFYWIGLSLPENEKAWKWRNGQPLTYTNWLTKKPDYVSVHKGKSAFVMEFSSKKWTAIDVENPIRKIVKYAIIEKEKLDSTVEVENE